LDDILQSKFKLVNPHIKYFKPSDFMPKIGFQLFDSIETQNKKIGDPMGFCALWCIWYVDMRITYKIYDRSKLVIMLIKFLKSNNISFKNMIRNYSKNIIDMRDVILYKSKIDINDWLNDQYTDDQIDLVIKLLSDDIKNI
jgi:hypothetical protein